MADFIDAIRKIGGTKFASYDDEGSTLVTGGLYWDIGRYAKEVEDNANEVSINTTTVTNLANEVDEKHTFVVDVKTNLVGSDGSYSNPSSGSVYRDIITKQTEVGTWYTALSSYSDQIQTVGNDLANGVNSYIIKVSDNIGYVGTVGTNLNKEENSDIVIVSNDLTGNKYIQTVVSKLGDVSKVADVSSYVPTVANINSEITEVARLNQQVEEVGSDLLKGSNSHISGLYNKMYIMEELYGTFGTTSTALGNIQTVATDLGLDADDDEATHSSINTVSYNINKVQGVFNALTPIQAVYDIKDSIEEIDTFKKHAEVLVIVDGRVTTAYPIIDNIPTVLKVVRTSNTKFVIANPVIEEISIANKVIDLGTTEFDGESIYVVYDYSSVSPQMETAFQDFKNTAIAIGEL
jgi:hypothetical protein